MFQIITLSWYHVSGPTNETQKRRAKGIAEVIKTSTETLIEEM